MAAAQSSALAVHVEAAKRLLRELEQHAETAMGALAGASENDSIGAQEFLAVVDDRDRILSELDGIVDAFAQEQLAVGDSPDERDPHAEALFAEMAQAAAAALESHALLTAQAGRERDRLAQALRRTGRPDSVANQYGAATASRARTLSVTG